jgi:hypothetical protein
MVGWSPYHLDNGRQNSARGAVRVRVLLHHDALASMRRRPRGNRCQRRRERVRRHAFLTEVLLHYLRCDFGLLS